MNNYIQTNSIKLHFLSGDTEKPVLILMHGLTANAHAFDGLAKAGLIKTFNVISVDLRGRGESEQPETGYSMADHAADILGLLDALKLTKVFMGGHSFGALLTLYIAKHFPERIDKMIILDAAARMHENTKEMLGPSLSRLDKTYPSFEYYLNKVKQAPYIDFWNDDMLSYYKADIRDNEDGTVSCIPQLSHMVFAVNGVLAEPWTEYLKDVEQHALLVNGPGIYTMGAPLLPEENARETVNMMQNCRYVKVDGNHQTMLYGNGAAQIVHAIHEFVGGDVTAPTSLHQ